MDRIKQELQSVLRQIPNDDKASRRMDPMMFFAGRYFHGLTHSNGRILECQK